MRAMLRPSWVGARGNRRFTTGNLDHAGLGGDGRPWPLLSSMQLALDVGAWLAWARTVHALHTSSLRSCACHPASSRSWLHCTDAPVRSESLHCLDGLGVMRGSGRGPDSAEKYGHAATWLLVTTGLGVGTRSVPQCKLHAAVVLYRYPCGGLAS